MIYRKIYVVLPTSIRKLAKSRAVKVSDSGMEDFLKSVGVL